MTSFVTLQLDVIVCEIASFLLNIEIKSFFEQNFSKNFNMAVLELIKTGCID